MTICQDFNENFECILENLHSIKNTLVVGAATQNHLDNLNLNDAINFLKRNGYPISKSTLYKLTSGSAIPFYRFGHRLVFKISELEDWCKSKTVQNGSTKEGVIAVSNSALKKIYNGKN